MSHKPETDSEFQKRHKARPAIVGAAMLGIAFLFVGIVLATVDWGRDKKSEIQKAGEQKLAELRAKQETDLASYGWVDKDKGVVRIPIADAIEKLTARGPSVK